MTGCNTTDEGPDGDAPDKQGRHVVIEADLPPFDAPANRVRVLATQIDAAIAQHGKVNLIAHSQGGLDSRYLISSLGYANRVASLTTISTSHRGTAVADKALGLLPGGIDHAVNVALETLGADVANVNVRAALTALAEANAPAFNAANPDRAGVYYQSWAGVSSKTGVVSSVNLAPCDDGQARHADAIDRVERRRSRRRRRGLATVESAKHGNFRGCFPADHTDEVGQVQDTFDPATGWDHLRFYRTAAFDLATRGL